MPAPQWPHCQGAPVSRLRCSRRVGPRGACRLTRASAASVLHRPLTTRRSRAIRPITWRSGCAWRTALPLEAHIENTVKVLRSVRQQALDLGVRIAVENHAGDMQAREVKGLIEAAGTDFVGSCLDTGNPMWVAEDPFVTLETLAPYV